jgi:hypothetical protein
VEGDSSFLFNYTKERKRPLKETGGATDGIVIVTRASACSMTIPAVRFYRQNRPHAVVDVAGNDAGAAGPGRVAQMGMS